MTSLLVSEVSRISRPGLRRTNNLQEDKIVPKPVDKHMEDPDSEAVQSE